MKPAVCLMFIVCLGAAGQASAQQDRPLDSASASKWNIPGRQNPALAFYAGKMGKPINLSGTHTSADGKSIDFSRLQRPAFIYFGFYGCHPCMHELPVVIESSNEHPEIDFVYITYDKEPVRNKEFAELGKKNFKPGSNFYIVEMHDEDILRSGLTWGYPTKYFVDNKGIVQFVQCGGNPTEPTAAIRERITKIVKGG